LATAEIGSRLPGLVGAAVRAAHAGGDWRDKEVAAPARIASLVEWASRLAHTSCGDVVSLRGLSPGGRLRLCDRLRPLARPRRTLVRRGGASLRQSGKAASATASRMAFIGERMEKARSHRSLPVRTLQMPKGFGVGPISPGRSIGDCCLSHGSSARAPDRNRACRRVDACRLPGRGCGRF
jgi:hypothetical protein